MYGAEAASRGYFGKRAAELSVAEAALVAGLVKSPLAYAPTVHMDRAVARRNVVLQAMLESGAIDRATWKQARAARVMPHDTLRAAEPHGQYFKEQVRRELVDRFGWQRVYHGGLRVFATINMPMQITAEQAVAQSLKLATEGCEDVEVVTRDGEVRHPSMVYTEYFAHGTEPTTYCDQHPTRGLLGTIAGVFGVGERSAPPQQIGESGPPAPVGTLAAGGEPPASELRKRGF